MIDLFDLISKLIEGNIVVCAGYSGFRMKNRKEYGFYILWVKKQS